MDPSRGSTNSPRSSSVAAAGATPWRLPGRRRIDPAPQVCRRPCTVSPCRSGRFSPSAVRLVPGSQWVTLHLDGTADIDLLMTLVSLALQAHQAWPDPSDSSRARCNDQHSGTLPHENLSGG
ncbi:luciferase family protein [Streptomyces sp. NPDC002328]|uniref:luciferase domain-containing protein n=1 Tax=Streptomyces sp. NPDC002328 TaxID=3364642 RepID=UPI00369FFF48